MNYFELYGFDPGFTIDQKLLKKRFYELSRQHHPDFYTREGVDAQADALEITSLVNKGYKTFQSKEATLKYLLELKGLVESEEKYPLNPLFLAEVMEINEQLMDIEMDPDPVRLAGTENATNTLQNNIYHEVEGVMDGYKEGVTTEKELLQLKDYYYQKKYLQRILDKIASLRNIAARK